VIYDFHIEHMKLTPGCGDPLCPGWRLALGIPIRCKECNLFTYADELESHLHHENPDGELKEDERLWRESAGELRIDIYEQALKAMSMFTRCPDCESTPRADGATLHQCQGGDGGCLHCGKCDFAFHL